jgi:thioredoxin-like negative regulator of GroEL
MSYRCVHSRAIEPVLHRVAETVKSRITICRIDVSVEPELADHYWIAGTPTFVMFLGALEVGRVEGPPPTFSAVLAAVTRPFTPTGARYENAG